MNKIFTISEVNDMVQNFAQSRELNNILETVENGVEDSYGFIHEFKEFKLKHNGYSIVLRKG